MEWKSRRQRSGGGAGTKLVLRNAVQRDELDLFIKILSPFRIYLLSLFEQASEHGH